MRYDFEVPGEFDGKRLSVFLKTGCGLSLSLVRSVKFLERGLLVDGVPAKTNYILAAGQKVSVSPLDRDSGLAPYDAAVPVIYESCEAIVYDKPAGMATHPTRGDPGGTLANVYAARMRGRGDCVFRPINRLDKNTSGLLLAAKSRPAAPLLAGNVQKKYLAVCEGSIPDEQGVINAPIARQPGSIIGRMVSPDGAPSVTRYWVIRRLAEHTLLEVVTMTGRTHQIRVHLSSIGHPLAGDTLYGGHDKEIGRHALHCAGMTFTDPACDQAIVLELPLPEDMRKLVDGPQ